MKKKILVVIVALLALGFILTLCGRTSSSKTDSASATGASAASESAASATNAASSEDAKAAFVGTWDMTWYKAGDVEYDEKALKKARSNGKDSFLVLEEDGTAALVAGSSRIADNVTWEPIDSAHMKLVFDGENLGPFELKDGTLEFKATNGDRMSFAKGEPRSEIPPFSSSSSASADSASKDSADENADESNETAEESGEVDPDLKEMLDSYEAFIDEYVTFMEEYQNSDDTMGMLQEYTEYMSRYTDFMQKVNEVDTDDMSAADLAYYTEVTARVSQKLLAVSL